MSVQHISDQRRAFEAALTIAKNHPDLPAACITFYRESSIGAFQVNTLSDWEQWRAALVKPSDVQVTSLGTGDLLAYFDATVSGFAVHVYVIDQIRSVVRGIANGETVVTPPIQPKPLWKRQEEDPHVSPLHHPYAECRDLPFIPGQQDRRAI